MSGSAYSIDGRTFSFEAPFAEAYPVGAYVKITADDGQRFLGQVLGEWLTSPGSLEGRGRLVADLGAPAPQRLDGSAVFGSASIALAIGALAVDQSTVVDQATAEAASGTGWGFDPIGVHEDLDGQAVELFGPVVPERQREAD